MKFLIIILFILTIIIETLSDYHIPEYKISDFAITRNCTVVYSIPIPNYVPYVEKYRTRNWLGMTKWKTRTNYRVENHMSWQNKSSCCHGYINYGSSMCIPVCNVSCGSYSICSKPDTCSCFEGYNMDHWDNQCHPVCLNECINGKCIFPNTCACNSGFKHVSTDSHTCEPVCNGCTDEEYCVEPHICRCKSGFHRSSTDRVDSNNLTMPCEPICDMPCKNAECVAPNVCKCNPGYADLDGDVYACEPICSHRCMYGFCSAPETCTCYSGYNSSTSDSHICEPICSQECINANCVAPDICLCNDGYIQSDAKPNVCDPYCNSSCLHGHCLAPNKCNCNDGYIPSYDFQSCEPFCMESCQMGNCTAPETCTCYEGYKLSTHSNFTCEPICNQDCTNGHCIAPDDCRCDDGYEMKNNSSNKCVVICECQGGFCNDESSACETCSEGYELVHNTNSTECHPHCEGNCSSHGRCYEPQRCDCDENYVSDNDTLGNPVCLHACGGDCEHGICQFTNGSCSCYYGWSGKFCEEAVACVVYLNYDSLMTTRPPESEDDYAVSIEEPWTGPICYESCLKAVNYSSKCLDDPKSNSTVCYMGIESPCNIPSVVMANLYKSDISFLTIITSSGMALLLLVTAVIVTLILHKKVKRKECPIVMTSNLHEEFEEDQLVDNNDDAVSL